MHPPEEGLNTTSTAVRAPAVLANIADGLFLLLLPGICFWIAADLVGGNPVLVDAVQVTWVKVVAGVVWTVPVFAIRAFFVARKDWLDVLGVLCFALVGGFLFAMATAEGLNVLNSYWNSSESSVVAVRVVHSGTKNHHTYEILEGPNRGRTFVAVPRVGASADRVQLHTGRLGLLWVEWQD